MWGSQTRVYAYAAPVDMRKGFDGLCALAREDLGRDPLSGDVFVFVSRNRIRAKVLHWDGTGLCVYAKRLERGRFAKLWDRSQDGEVNLTVSELLLFLEGSRWIGRQALSPPRLDPDELRAGIADWGKKMYPKGYRKHSLRSPKPRVESRPQSPSHPVS